MRKIFSGVCVGVQVGMLAALLTATLSPSAQSQTLYGKVDASAQKAYGGITSDVTALKAVEAIKIPINTRSTLYEYTSAVLRAKTALEVAETAGAPGNIELLKAALDKHLLAIEFINECNNLKNDFFCDEKRASVAEVLRRYPTPRKIETIAPRSVVEALNRYPRPWFATRVRADLHQVVEYIPYAEQKKVLKILWTQAREDTRKAAIALGMPYPGSN